MYRLFVVSREKWDKSSSLGSEEIVVWTRDVRWPGQITFFGEDLFFKKNLKKQTNSCVDMRSVFCFLFFLNIDIYIHNSSDLHCFPVCCCTNADCWSFTVKAPRSEGRNTTRPCTWPRIPHSALFSPNLRGKDPYIGLDAMPPNPPPSPSIYEDYFWCLLISSQTPYSSSQSSLKTAPHLPRRQHVSY